MNIMTQPFVSVVIPVFNDSEALIRCLSALDAQTYPRELYEVIVVDNGSEEDIKGIVSRFDRVRFGYEPSPGSYLARNQGIALAKGEIIAFTDSDCLPQKQWIECGVFHLLDHSNCGLLAGKIETSFQDPQNPNSVELYDKILAFPQKNYIQNSNFGVTANLFTFKKVIDRVGNFDENLKSGGDYEWGQRVYRAGYQQIYTEDACVFHPARSSFKQLSKKIARVVKGQYDLQEKNAYTKPQFIKEAFKDLMPPLKFAIGLYQKHDNLSHGQKIQVTWIRLKFKYTRAWERFKLLFNLIPQV